MIQPIHLVNTTLKRLILPSFARRKWKSYFHARLMSVDRDIDLARSRIAAEESASFLNSTAPMAKSYPDNRRLFDAAISAVNVSGLFCEFGVFSGASINYVASKITGTVHGFDSFEGLPEDWRVGFEAGTFKVKELPKVSPNVILHKGWFTKSIPGFLRDYSGPIAFLHIDCDLYSSTATVLRALADRIVAGTVIQFDEFFNYPGWRSGEYEALTEFCRERSVELQYLGYVSNGEQLAVMVTAISPPSVPSPAETVVRTNLEFPGCTSSSGVCAMESRN